MEREGSESSSLGLERRMLNKWLFDWSLMVFEIAEGSWWV